MDEKIFGDGNEAVFVDPLYASNDVPLGNSIDSVNMIDAFLPV